jgi:hypothetical protein
MLPRIVPQPVNPSPKDGRKPSARVFPRILKVIYILYWGIVGIALVLFPWQSIWENNYLLYLYPQIRPLVANPFFKGAVLGLGIVNILIGIREIVHFKNASRGFFSR